MCCLFLHCIPKPAMCGYRLRLFDADGISGFKIRWNCNHE
jgi:hypothetical protein